MNNQEFKSIMILLIPLLVKEIVSAEKIEELDAVSNLYESTLYEKLKEEETKLWHLSPKALYELYKQEKVEGCIDWPTEM